MRVAGWVLRAAFLGLAALYVSEPVRAQEDLWKIQKSDDGTIVAGLAIDHPGASGSTIMTLLNVGFHSKRACQPELGFALLQGSGYGNVVGKVSPPKTEPVSLTVNQMPVSTPAPFLFKYENGWEAVFPASPQLVAALVGGTTATVQIVSGTPRFEFPITGAGSAMAKARQQCISGH